MKSQGTLRIGLAALVSLVFPVCLASAQTWTPTSAPETNWIGVASSADGTHLIAATCCNGFIYLSADSGGTWRIADSPYTNYSAVAISADGLKLLALNETGFFFSSTNSGVTWQHGSMPEGSLWTGYSVALSADGNTWATGNVIRKELENRWIVQTNFALISVLCSADGMNLAGLDANGFYHHSSDGGLSWSTNTSLYRLRPLACSVDGRKLWAALPVAEPGEQLLNYIYTSSDFGANWQRTSAPYSAWTSAASGWDGSRLAIQTFGTGDNNPIYTSMDSGATWLPNTLPGPLWGLWFDGQKAVSGSVDGCRLVAGSQGTGIYTYQATLAPLLNAQASGTNLLLQWVVPCMSFDLQESPMLPSTNWVGVSSVPAMNYTTVQYEVTIPRSPQLKFYRLALSKSLP